MKKLQTLIAGVILGSMLIFTPTYATEVAKTEISMEAATTEYVTQPTLRTPKKKNYISNVKEYIFSSFSWVYILCVAFFFLFLVILCLGKLSDIRLGNEGQLLPTKVGSL